MTAGKVKEQPSRNSIIFLSQTLEGDKNKPTNNHTYTHEKTAANLDILP